MFKKCDALSDFNNSGCLYIKKCDAHSHSFTCFQIEHILMVQITISEANCLFL